MARDGCSGLPKWTSNRSHPDLNKLPMYCSVISLKDWYDAKDMRATGGNDVNFAMDVAKVDSLTSQCCAAKARSSTRWLRPKALADRRLRAPQRSARYSPWAIFNIVIGRPAMQPLRTLAVCRVDESNGWAVSVAAQSGHLLDLRTVLGVLQGAGVQEQCGSICRRRASTWTAGFSKNAGDRAGIIASPSRMQRWSWMRLRVSNRKTSTPQSRRF